MNADEMIRLLAYGKVQPLLKPNEQWTSRKISELWAKLALFPAVCVRELGSPYTARQAATQLRRQLGCQGNHSGSPYEVKVEGCQVVVYTRVHLRDLPPPPPKWHAWYSPQEWMDREEAMELLGIRRDRLAQLVREYRVPFQRIDSHGTRIYDREAVTKLLVRRKPNRKQRRPRPRKFVMSAVPG